MSKEQWIQCMGPMPRIQNTERMPVETAKYFQIAYFQQQVYTFFQFALKIFVNLQCCTPPWIAFGQLNTPHNPIDKEARTTIVAVLHVNTFCSFLLINLIFLSNHVIFFPKPISPLFCRTDILLSKKIRFNTFTFLINIKYPNLLQYLFYKTCWLKRVSPNDGLPIKFSYAINGCAEHYWYMSLYLFEFWDFSSLSPFVRFDIHHVYVWMSYCFHRNCPVNP